MGEPLDCERMAGDEGMPGSAAVALGPLVCAPGDTVVVLDAAGVVVVVVVDGDVVVDGEGLCIGVVAAPGVVVVVDAGVPDRSTGWPGVGVWAVGEDALKGPGVGVLCASA